VSGVLGSLTVAVRIIRPVALRQQNKSAEENTE
jgi:hypothetical protein